MCFGMAGVCEMLGKWKSELGILLDAVSVKI